MPEEGYGEQKESSAFGAILGILIIVLILILGGLYVWGSMLQNQTIETQPEGTFPTAEENNEPESTNAEAEVETMQALSTSNEVSALESDIEATKLETLHEDIAEVDLILQ